jgi:hypothetical protein
VGDEGGGVDARLILEADEACVLARGAGVLLFQLRLHAHSDAEVVVSEKALRVVVNFGELDKLLEAPVLLAWRIDVP